MRMGKRILSIALAMALIMGLLSLPAAATDVDTNGELSYSDGRTVISWQKFYDKATVNGGISRTKVTDGTGLFAQYVQMESVRTDSNQKNSQLQYKDAADGSINPRYLVSAVSDRIAEAEIVWADYCREEFLTEADAKNL